MTTYRDPWMKKARWLTQALIISCTLNVGLLSTFIYFAMSENPDSLERQKSPSLLFLKENMGLQKTLNKYSNLSFQDLLLCLGNHDLVEAGWTKRDLALGCLVAFYHFNLERALGGSILQKKEIHSISSNGEVFSLSIFPGLADYQFQAIIHYAKTEKWPLTSEGLFFKIKETKLPYDPSLLEAFSLTPEFHFINLLFSKTGIQLKKEYLTVLLSQSSWPTLTETTKHLRENGSFTPEERRHFLLRLIGEKSKIAAKIFLEVEQEYCLKYLDDGQVLALCNLLGDKTPSAFLKQLLESSRGDAIWKTAAALLYDQAEEKIPEVWDLEEVKQRFIHLKAPSITTQSKSEKKEKIYTVKSGDSLWKIAKEQGTSVKDLRKINHLETDCLKIGQKILIQ